MKRPTWLTQAMIAVCAAALVALGGYWLALESWIANHSQQPLRPAPGGTLVICGGGAVPERVMQHFLELAGGDKARLVVLPAYRPSETELATIRADWQQRGVKQVTVLSAASREESETADFAAPLAEATAVWIGGGDQNLLTTLYAGTAVERQLHALLERGGVVGGSSAGAAAMSRVMIANGFDEAAETRGFDLLPDAVIDQHFLRRNRMQRLMGIVTSHDGLIGLGIDEGTAVVVQLRAQMWKVIGDSYAVVCLPREDNYPRIEILKPGDHVGIEGLKLNPGAYVVANPEVMEQLFGENAEK